MSRLRGKKGTVFKPPPRPNQPITDDVLHMMNGPDDKAAAWVSIAVRTMVRGPQLGKTDDINDGYITNMGAAPGETIERTAVKLDSKDFAVSRVALNYQSPTRYAIAYTTVRKDKFVTFVFAGNNRNEVERVALSMNTIKFVP